MTGVSELAHPSLNKIEPNRIMWVTGTITSVDTPEHVVETHKQAVEAFNLICFLEGVDPKRLFNFGDDI